MTPDEIRTPSKLAHFVVRTKHYRATVDWYCTVLGARPVFANDGIAFLTYDDEHHRIAVAHAPWLDDPSPKAAGVDHVAFTFRSLDDLRHTYRRLKALQITPYWCVNHGPTTSMYYRDPNGVQVELQIDNFPDEASLKAWMRTDAFRDNPIGTTFDPDAL